MSSWPIHKSNSWSDLVVGGAYGEPLLFKLYENALVSNGSFEDVLSSWDGAGSRKDFGDKAASGNYALSLEGVPYMHTYFSRTSPETSQDMTSVLFTGYVKAKIGSTTGSHIYLKVYCDNGTSRVASPTKYVQLAIDLDADAVVTAADGYTQWIKFYIDADISAITGDYVHFEISSDKYSSIYYYLDELKVYEVEELLELACPQTLRLNWQRKTDANYEMADGTNKDYLKGWRPIFSLGYDYCSREELIKHIGISESGFNFFAPHKDSCNGEYVRIISNFEASYFHDKFLGHTDAITLNGIFLRKFKNIEYDSAYFLLSELFDEVFY